MNLIHFMLSCFKWTVLFIALAAAASCQAEDEDCVKYKTKDDDDFSLLQSPTAHLLQTSALIQKAADLLPLAKAAIKTEDVGSVKAVQAQTNQTRQLVWVNAFGRTGSSLVLDLVRESGANETDVFALFEPCHQGNFLGLSLADRGCGELLSHVSRCDFRGIDHLWGWDSDHTSNKGQAYSQELATKLCMNATLIAVKTVRHQHSVSASFLLKNPEVRVISLVRDPRSAYASMLELQHNHQGSFHTDSVYTMLEMCDAFSDNANVSSPHLLNVVYEELVQDPVNTTRAIYRFLGRPFREKDKNWVDANFNSECAESDEPYSTCRSNSTASLERYKYELTNTEFAAFMAHDRCREVCDTYNYDCFYFRPPEPQHSGLFLGAIALGILTIVVLIFVGCRYRYT